MSVEKRAETDSVNVFCCNPGSVLDIGCRSGPMRAVLSHAWCYVGIDLSFVELQEARLPGRQNLVEAALSKTYRVLKDGGTFAFIRPSATPDLPKVLENRRLLVATQLTWMASFAREVPISISLTVAQKSISGTS